MTNERLYDVTITTPVTVRVWAQDEEDAKKVAFLSTRKPHVVGFPDAITVQEVELVKWPPRGKRNDGCSESNAGRVR